jgi:hypothetical protein
MQRPDAPEEIRLDAEKIAAALQLDEEFFDEYRVSETLELIRGSLTVQAQKVIYAYKAGTMEYEFPATPWEFFRSRYFPRLGRLGAWWLRRKPLRYRYHRQSAEVLFPELGRPSFPEGLGRSVWFLPQHRTSVNIVEKGPPPEDW